MSAKQCAQTTQAIYLHQYKGYTVAEAARMSGIWRSTLYRALQKLPQKKGKK